MTNQNKTSIENASESATMEIPGSISWRCVGVPLLPNWYFREQSEIPLPDSLSSLLPPTKNGKGKIGDLEHIWEHRDIPLSTTEKRFLSNFIRTLESPPKELIAIPGNLDVNKFLMLPLEGRAKNSLLKGINNGIFDNKQDVTVNDLFTTTHLSLKSLLELMCLAEHVAKENYFDGIEHKLNQINQSKSMSFTEIAIPLISAIVGSDLAPSNDVGELLRILSISDRFESLPVLPNNVSDVDTEQAITTIVKLIVDNLILYLVTQSEINIKIILDRSNPYQKVTLDTLGTDFDLSRERVRQLEKKIKEGIDAIEIANGSLSNWISLLACVQSTRIEESLELREFEDILAGIIPLNRNAKQLEIAAVELTRNLLAQAMNVTLIDGDIITQDFEQMLHRSKDIIASICDETGLATLEEVKNALPKNYLKYWDTIYKHSNLYLYENTYIGIRNSAKASVKAALLDIGKPASRDELAEKTGFSKNVCGAVLSNLNSVVRVNKNYWAMEDWTDQKYKGIHKAIIEMIEENGGSASVEMIVKEFPSKYDVAVNSVNAFLKTPQYKIENGQVSLSDSSNVTVGDLEDKISGYTSEGKPYWSFKVKNLYLKGYSIPHFPNEVAVALGSTPNSYNKVPIKNPPNCGEMSVVWRLTTIGGANIGRVREALTAMDAQDGETIWLVLEPEQAVSFQRPE